MIVKCIRIFVYLTGVILLVTATAKVVSACGNSRILQMPDPVFAISFRRLFWIAGILELAVACTCFIRNIPLLQTGLIACLSTSFLIYRVGATLAGWNKPCRCLGNLTDAVHISPETADAVMKTILACLLIGSYTALFWFWRQRRVAPTSTCAVNTSR